MDDLSGGLSRGHLVHQLDFFVRPPDAGLDLLLLRHHPRTRKTPLGRILFRSAGPDRLKILRSTLVATLAHAW
jgi:hypothetical protein